MNFTPSLIGLDIQPDGVCLAQVKRQRNHMLLEGIAMGHFTEAVFVEGKIKHWPIVSAVLAQMVEANHIAGMAAAIHLPTHLVRMQHLSLPMGLDETAIKAEIAVELQRDLPGLTERLAMDFIFSTPLHEGYANLFFVAARLAYLEDYIQCVNSAGLQVKIADVDCYAMMRAVCFAHPFRIAQGEIMAILHLRKSMATLIIINVEEEVFCQYWEMSAPENFFAQLKSKIELYHATCCLAVLQQLVVCADRGALSEEVLVLLPSLAREVHYVSPFTAFKIGKHVDRQLMQTRAADFLLATGLALREVPLW